MTPPREWDYKRFIEPLEGRMVRAIWRVTRDAAFGSPRDAGARGTRENIPDHTTRHATEKEKP